MSEDEALTKTISHYYLVARPEEELTRMMRIADVLAKNQLQQKLIKIIFATLQKLRKIETFNVQVARMMKLLNDMLERDEGKQERLQYGKIISNHLIEIYTYIFEHVFKFNLTELIIVLKTYRMHWAKRITDNCFDSLKRQVGLRFKNFDLERGFPDETIAKIVKRYRKRGFTDHQILRYMPAAKKKSPEGHRKVSKTTSGESYKKSTEMKSPYEEAQSISNQSASDQERRNYRSHSQDPKPAKKVRKSESPQRMVNSPEAMRPHNGIPGPETSAQMLYNPGFYNPQPYYPSVYGQPFGNQMLGGIHSQPFSNMSQPACPPVSRSPIRQSLGFVEDPRIKSFSNPPQSPYYYRQEGIHSNNKQLGTQQGTNEPLRNVLKQKLLLRSLYDGGKECKECGICLSTLKTYDEHMQRHYAKSKHQYEIQHRKQTVKREFLSGQQEWIQQDKLDLSTVKFRVPVKKGSTDQECVYCNNRFVISWSEELCSWVFQNAIQTEVIQGRHKERGLAHYQCYDVFNKERQSADSKLAPSGNE